MKQKPHNNQYHPYFDRYISLVKEGPVFQTLHEQGEEELETFYNISEDMADLRYEEGKWSVKEVIGHMADVERALSYILFAAARGDKPTFTPFDKDQYMKKSLYTSQNIQKVVLEFVAVRGATNALLMGVARDTWQQTALVLDHDTTVRALVFIIAGHTQHHLNILKERYGIGASGNETNIIH